MLSLELLTAAHKAGRCSMPGSSPDVGAIGYAVGGGLSWLARKYGFTCNHIRAFDVVTADGEARRVDADNEPELADWHDDGSYLNFTEAEATTGEIFDSDTAAKLAEVKRTWDPDRRIVANHAP